jgi:thiol-disulfide isomerase/thioredoxin
MAAADSATPDAAPAPKLPYEDLVSAAGNRQLDNLYRQTETGLSTDPSNPQLRLQRVFILNNAAMRLIGQGDRDRGLQASRAAFEQVQSVLPELPQPLPEGLGGLLAMVFYNGACVQSLDGKAEDALGTLQKALDFGFDDLNMLRDDADLAAVRALPGYDQHLETWANTIRQRIVERAQATLAAGETFPFDFSLTDLGGQPISLSSLLGKVVIVDIWGTWCPPCREEIPSFIQMQTELGPQGLQIVGLNYQEQGETEEEKAETVRKFIEEFGINYPCAMGTDEIQQQVPNFEGFPTTLFIDRSGRVRAKLVGLHDKTYLQTLVELLLAEALAPPTDAAVAPPADTSATPPAAPGTPPPADPGTPPPADPGTPPPADPGAPPPAPAETGGTPPADSAPGGV